ncbi:MAG: bifunctional response regulator/alkaline phosphatase family protein [Bacteroidota bacterium]|nr:PglZ domain-containing protein [Candidatus Kapabacteria bacterium]MDW8220280.1 bifunctional response regulator/alkaline phosphatase family protein [Bacteroidota bacterium]
MPKHHILWVDDEIDLLRPHIILLQQRGYDISTATNGEDAIELFKQDKHDLIFLDESMVGMSGLETLSALKDIDNSVPVVMVTKNEAETVMEEAIGRKIDDYLTKPVNPAQILAACKKFLESEKITSQKLTRDYLQGFSEISRLLMEELSWQEWIDIYTKLVHWSMELDRFPDLGLSETLANQWRECNAAFSSYVERSYRQWLTSPDSPNTPLLSPKILDTYVLPALKSYSSVFFFIIDCMRLDQWLLMEELLRPLYTITKDYYYSILPTATPYARNAIFAGLYPDDIQKHYPEWWVEGSGEDYGQNRFEKELLTKFLERRRVKLRNDVKYVKIIDTEFGKKIENEILSYAHNHLNAIVVNVVDMIAHSRSDYPILKEIAPNESAYRSLTRSWFQHSSLYGMLKSLANLDNIRIVITTDHGSVRCMRGAKAFGDKETSTCLRFKFGRNVKAEKRNAMIIEHPEEYHLPRHSVTTNYIIAKEDYYFVYPTEYNHYLNHYRDSFQHGGISLEEMILPVIHLEAK